jgi:hypothetical protein
MNRQRDLRRTVILNVQELFAYADAFGADAADIIRSVVKARG